MADRLKNNLDKIAVVLSGVLGVAGIYITLTGKLEEAMQSTWFQGSFTTLLFLLVMCVAFWAYFSKKGSSDNQEKIGELKNRCQSLETDNEKLDSEVQLLRKNICSGIEYISNDVTIEFIKGEKPEDHKYKLTFTKRSRVIGETRWYSGQVYFNKDLKDDEASEKFYQENQIAWEGLNASARIITYEDGTPNIHEADIYAVAKSPRYFQFHIRYGTNEGGCFNPAEFGEFDIVYSYEVPITHWGSYINRTVSCFGEAASVIIKMDLKNKKVNAQKNIVENFKNALVVYDKKLDDEPTINTEVKPVGSLNTNAVASIEIKLPQKKAHKYIVSWDPKIFFGQGCERTQITKDSAELTAR